MSALRRDLLERKLWPVVALLVLALVAVPVLLLKGASAGGTALPPAPPAASKTSSQTTTTTQAPENEPVKVVLARIARDPFASGVPKLSSKPATAKSSAASSSSTAASASTPASTTSSSATAPVSMVSPAPASGPSASGGSSAASTGASGSSSAASTLPTSTIASTPPSALKSQPAKVQSWNMYSVSVRFGTNLSVPVKTNLARLTPLPSVMAPQVMFMGVMSNGTSVVFALHAGVGHSGPGLCRPDREHCSAIVLEAGQTEHLSVPTATGHQDLVLRVVRIGSSITHSRQVALAAYHRVSDAGQCELDLANPVSYDSVTGTISSVVKNACQQHPDAVPFA
jgi:hypothetical protein